MKKFLVLALTLMMSLGVASVSLGSTVYMDVWSGGKFEEGNNSNSDTCDLSQVSIGIDIPMDEFKFAGNISSGVIKGRKDFDTTSILLKGGYALIDNDQIRLDVTGGFYDRTINIDDYVKINNINYLTDTLSFYSLVFGLDTNFKLNKNVWVDFSYSLGIAPQAEAQTIFNTFTGDLDSISILNLKFNYLFIENFGASLGYQSEKIGFEDSGDYTFSGLTLGAFYKF